MNDVQYALSQIADIRAHLVAGVRFRGYAPEVSALAGVLALVLAAAQMIWPQTLLQDNLHYVALWGWLIMAYAVIFSVSSVIARARLVHGRMADTLLTAALSHNLPFAAAGIIITLVICEYSPAAAWVLPGLWQILLGLLGFTGRASLPNGMVWVSGWYFLCGTGVLVLSSQTGVLAPWMMGVPIAVGQTAIAFIFRVNRES